MQLTPRQQMTKTSPHGCVSDFYSRLTEVLLHSFAHCPIKMGATQRIVVQAECKHGATRRTAIKAAAFYSILGRGGTKKKCEEEVERDDNTKNIQKT